MKNLIKFTKQLMIVNKSIEKLERNIFLGNGNIDIMNEELNAKYKVKWRLEDEIILL
jgi:hypothetical protein